MISLHSLHTTLLFCLVTLLSPGCQGHGRLIEPPSRSSMWRFGYDTPHNYEDNQLFCGGVGMQHGTNGGKCGVCGDPWNGPLENEPGGKFANGIIVRNYDVDQVINVTIELTANHKGYFEFKICPSNKPFNKVTQECLDKYPLKFADTGDVKYMLPDSALGSKFYFKLNLPQGLKCSACMLQWKYNAGNSWGKDADGNACVGCGNQEQFYGCADVAVGNPDVKLGVRPPGTMKQPKQVETKFAKSMSMKIEIGLTHILTLAVLQILRQISP